MSKYSEELERTYGTTGRMKKLTEEYKELLKKKTAKEKKKYWIHKDPNWGCNADLSYNGKEKKKIW